MTRIQEYPPQKTDRQSVYCAAPCRTLLSWKLTNGRPTLPSYLPGHAAAAHHSGKLLAQPLLGLFTVWLTIGAVKIPSSTWALPSPFPVDPELAKTLKGVHLWLGKAFYWVIGLHLLAALWHHLVRKDDTLKRML